MKTSSRFLMFATMAGLLDPDAWTAPQRAPTVHPRCGLPGCDQPANRGGYCSAEHCRQMKERDQQKRKKA